MADSSTPVAQGGPILTWDNLNYDVKTKDGTRRILHDISGSIYPGELVAIMGSSGAGKTTLLNVLAGRVQGGRLYGDIKFVGAQRQPHTFKRLLSYVEQDDLMFPALTVEETLRASAQLRLPDSKYSAEQKEERIATVLRQLRLSHVKDTFIGGYGMRGVSGGERKRVSIGAELVTDPSILVLDEPSSGLDSSSAEMVVSLTKAMSRQRNLSTLMTIHQPSAEMVAQFDKLILLAQGKLVYMGPAPQALPYFESLGYPSTNPNPANFFIDLMTVDFSSPEVMQKSEERVQTLVDSFAQIRERGSLLLPSPEGEKSDGTADNTIHSDSSSSSGVQTQHSSFIKEITHEEANLVLTEAPPVNSWFRELFILLRRDWTLTMRSNAFVYGLLAQCLAMLIFISFVFFQIDNDQASVQNRIGTLFTIVLIYTYPVILPVMTVIMVGRSVLLRERSGGSYRMSSYFFARALSLVPITYIPYTVVYTGIYFISHLQYDAGKYFIGLATTFALMFSSLGFSFAMAMAVSRMEVAHTMAPVTLAVFMLFAGNLSNANAITPVLRWIKYVCMFYYPYSSLMQNEFGGLEFTCDNSNSACYATGADVVSTYGLDQVPIYGCILASLALGVGFYIIAYCALRWVAKPRYLWL